MLPIYAFTVRYLYCPLFLFVVPIIGQSMKKFVLSTLACLIANQAFAATNTVSDTTTIKTAPATKAVTKNDTTKTATTKAASTPTAGATTKKPPPIAKRLKPQKIAKNKPQPLRLKLQTAKPATKEDAHTIYHYAESRFGYCVFLTSICDGSKTNGSSRLETWSKC